MKKWPKDDQPASYEELIKPIRKALEGFYTLTPKKGVKGIKYDGYDAGGDVLAVCFHANEQLDAKGIAYHEEQGRDALDAVLQVCAHVFMEQGRRSEIQKSGPSSKMLERLEDRLKELAKAEKKAEKNGK